MSAQEKKEQDRWVQKNVFDKSAPCPKGFTWDRVPWPRSDGYVCKGGMHLVIDEMIADGLVGFWGLEYEQLASRNFDSLTRNTKIRVGPYF
jgi:hypothetical protein